MINDQLNEKTQAKPPILFSKKKKVKQYWEIHLNVLNLLIIHWERWLTLESARPVCSHVNIIQRVRDELEMLTEFLWA